MKRNALAAIVAALVVSAGIVTAVSAIFPQSFPAVPRSDVFAMCNDLAGPVAVGSTASGRVIFTCPYPWTHALHSHPNASAMPGFNRPAPYTSVHLVPLPYVNDGRPCADFVGSRTLTSSVWVNFPSTFTEWDYCLEHGQVDPPGLPGFTITWTVA